MMVLDKQQEIILIAFLTGLAWGALGMIFFVMTLHVVLGK